MNTYNVFALLRDGKCVVYSVRYSLQENSAVVYFVSAQESFYNSGITISLAYDSACF